MSHTKHDLRIMHIASGDLWAGAEVQLYTQLKSLLPYTNISLHVVLMNDGELACRLRGLPLQVTVLDESESGFVSILFQLSRLARSWSPDIVHTHRRKENIVGSLAGFFVGAVGLRTAHGAPEFSYSLWRQPHQFLLSYLDLFVGRYLQAAVVAVSSELAAGLSSIFGDAKVSVVLNGVDVEALKSLAPVEFGADFNIGMVGRLEPVKRGDLFLQMADLLRSEAGAWGFHIVGDGSLSSELRTMAAGNDCVSFHGHVDNSPAWIAGLDVLVMCSDHEGLPMTALEALALGVPVVAHDVGGLSALVSASAAGGLVEEQSARLYAQRVREVLASKNEVIFPERYSSRENASELLSLYHGLLGGG